MFTSRSNLKLQISLVFSKKKIIFFYKNFLLKYITNYKLRTAVLAECCIYFIRKFSHFSEYVYFPALLTHTATLDLLNLIVLQHRHFWGVAVSGARAGLPIIRYWAAAGFPYSCSAAVPGIYARDRTGDPLTLSFTLYHWAIRMPELVLSAWSYLINPL